MATASHISSSRRSDTPIRDSIDVRRILDVSLEATWLIGIILVPLIVLSEERFISMTSLPKITVLRILSSAIVVLFSIKVSWSLLFDSQVFSLNLRAWLQKLRNPGWALVASAGGVLIATLLSTLFSISPSASLWGADPSGDGGSLYASVAYATFFVAIATFARTKTQIERLWIVVSLTGFVAALIGVAQHFGISPFGISGTNGVRVTGTSGNPIFFGALLVLTAPMAMAYLLGRLRSAADPRLIYLLAGLGTSVFVLALLATLSRGPWLGATIALITFIVFSWKMGIGRLELRFAISAAIGAIIALAIFFSPVSTSLSSSTGQDDASEIGSGALENASARLLNNDTATTRLSSWSASLVLSIDRRDVPGSSSTPRPIRHLFGYGPDTFRYVYPLEADGFFLRWRTSSAHNDPLNRLVEQGIIGFLFWTILWGVAVWGVFSLVWNRFGATSEYRLLGIGLGAALAGRFTEQLTGIPQAGDSLILWGLLALLAVVLLRRTDPSKRKPQAVTHQLTPGTHTVRATLLTLCFAVAVAAIFIAWNRNVDYLRADIAASSVVYGQASNPAEAIKLIEKAIGLAPDVPEYRHIQSAVYQGQADSTNVVDVSYTNLTHAYNAELAALNRYPFDREMYFRTAAITWELAKLGVPGKAEETLQLYEELHLLAPDHELVGPRIEILRQQLQSPQ